MDPVVAWALLLSLAAFMLPLGVAWWLLGRQDRKHRRRQRAKMRP